MPRSAPVSAQTTWRPWQYAELLQLGQTASDAVYQEKCREDALRDLGWQVVRWNWADLKDPAAIRRRLERAFKRGRGASRPT